MWHRCQAWTAERKWLIANGCNIKTYGQEKVYQKEKRLMKTIVATNWAAKKRVFRINERLAEKFLRLS